MKNTLLVSLMCVVLSIPVTAQELGRESLESANDKGLGRAPLPLAEQPNGFLGGTGGFKLGVGWAISDWDIGPADGSDGSFAPSVSLFYKASDCLDINMSALFVSGEDTYKDGETEAEMTRISIGLRYWPIVSPRINPYLGCGLGYYFLDGKVKNVVIDNEKPAVTGSLDVDDALGAYAEGGVAFQLTDNLFFNVELVYDLLLSSPDASVQDENLDFDINVFTINLGITVTF